MLFFHDFKAKNSKKFDYYNENMYTNSYFQMHLSRWGKRFRWCRKNKKCSIFHDLSEYIIFIWLYLNVLVWSFKFMSIFSKFSVLSILQNIQVYDEVFEFHQLFLSWAKCRWIMLSCQDTQRSSTGTYVKLPLNWRWRTQAYDWTNK